MKKKKTIKKKELSIDREEEKSAGAKVLLFLSIGYCIISIIQWFFLYPDQSQLFLGIGISISLLFLSLIYERTYYNQLKNENIESRLDSLVFPQ